MTSELNPSYVNIDMYMRSDGSFVDGDFSFMAAGPR